MISMEIYETRKKNMPYVQYAQKQDENFGIKYS